MKLLLIHGRTNPEQEMSDWGFNGPDIENVEWVHSAYGHFTVGFKRIEDAMKAKELTGWEWFDENVLEISGHEDLIHTNEKGRDRYYGDWELQED